jgi:hypothetical protein
MDAPEVRGLEEVDEYLLQSKRSLEKLKNEYIMAKAAYEKVLEKISATEDKVDSEVNRREKLYTGFIDASIREFSPISVDFETVQQEPSQPISANIAIPSAQSSNSNSSGVMHSSSPPSSISAVSLLGAVGKSVSSGGAGSVKYTAASGGDDPHSHQDHHGNSSAGVLGYLTTNTMNVASNAASVTTNAAQTATAAGGWIARRFSLGIQSIVKIPTGVPDPHGEDLGIASDDSISVPDRVMSPDGFSTVMSSPPNETDNYFDAPPIPDSNPTSPSTVSKLFPGVVSLQAAATAAAAAVAAEQKERSKISEQKQAEPVCEVSSGVADTVHVEQETVHQETLQDTTERKVENPPGCVEEIETTGPDNDELKTATTIADVDQS